MMSLIKSSPNLVGKRIGQLAYAVYGTKEFLERVSENSEDEKIPCITWIGDSNTRPPWIEKNFPRAKHIYRTSVLGVMIQMLHESMGIAQIPCVIGDTDPLLHRIPVNYVEPGWGLWVLSHVDLRTTARVRIFRDFLVSELESKKELIEGRANKI